jgi:hypothetical protein
MGDHTMTHNLDIESFLVQLAATPIGRECYSEAVSQFRGPLTPIRAQLALAYIAGHALARRHGCFAHTHAWYAHDLVHTACGVLLAVLSGEHTSRMSVESLVSQYIREIVQ